jgi:hypothetical protein
VVADEDAIGRACGGRLSYPKISILECEPFFYKKFQILKYLFYFILFFI